MQENELNKFHTIVSEVFVGDPVVLRIDRPTIIMDQYIILKEIYENDIS